MGIKEKLFYKNDIKTGEKRTSKLKIIAMSLLIIILLFVAISGIIALMTPDESVRQIHTQILAYDYLPNGSLDEKTSYVLSHYAETYDNALAPDEYLRWLSDSGVDVESNLDAVSSLFEAYDDNSNNVLEREEIRTFLYHVASFNKTLEDAKNSEQIEIKNN